MFRIYQADKYGHPVSYLGIFRANNSKEARLKSLSLVREKAAGYWNSKEIASTGFYGAEEVTQEEIDDMIRYHQNEINKLTVLG